MNLFIIFLPKWNWTTKSTTRTFTNEKGKPYKSSGGEMVDSELGEIPKWWKVGKLGDIMENFDSKRFLYHQEKEKKGEAFIHIMELLKLWIT